MNTPSLQDGIDKAGSPLKLLWRPNAAPFKVPVVAAEYVGWREEQAAWRSGVTISDLSHHMSDTFIEGPEATLLLKAVSANDYERFEIGQAKQFVPVARSGLIITDGILLREGPEQYTLSGVPASQTWVRYHAEKGGYDVKCVTDPDSGTRKGGDPVLFRYQIQGPLALEMIEKVFGAPIPKTKFFHSTPVTLRGKYFRALRHGMVGQPGYEFIGAYADGAEVKDALMAGGRDFGLIHVGGLAYATNGIESGWIPTPTPAIYTAPELTDYRRWLSFHSYEGMKPLHGTWFSEDIEDYYVSPFELGYAKSIAFNHDFIGRPALEDAQGKTRRTKVTVVFERDDVRAFLGTDPEYTLSYARYRIEVSGKPVGMTFYTAYIHPEATILALALVDAGCAEPGTPVTVVWGEHPGSDAPAGIEQNFTRLRATLQPSPYNEFARSQYRRNE